MATYSVAIFSDWEAPDTRGRPLRSGYDVRSGGLSLGRENNRRVTRRCIIDIFEPATTEPADPQLSFSTFQFGVRQLIVVAGAPTAGWSVRVRAFAQVPKVSRLRLRENWELLSFFRPFTSAPLGGVKPSWWQDR